MDISNTIKTRRSIRKYTDKIPSDKEIEAILEAGCWAPSGLNNQPWKFKVLKDKAKDQLSNFTHYGNVLESAPIAICVFLDKSTMYNRDKDLMAIGACIQNMLLQADEMGLATCWLGEILNKKKDVEEDLKIEKDCELMAVITLGFPDEKEESQRKSLKDLLLK